MQDFIYHREENVFNIDQGSFSAPFQKVSVTYENQTFEADVRLRGGVSFCGSFPQLKLKLPKDHLIEGQKEFKILTHGVYKMDPNIPIIAPNCGDGEEMREGDELVGFTETKRIENMIYDLSAKILDLHLNNIKFDVRYRDLAHSIDLTERAYFLEDKDFAAKRYDMKPYVLEGINSRISWTEINTPAGLLDDLLQEEFLSNFTEQYRTIQGQNPSWKAEQISAHMKQWPELEADEDFMATAKLNAGNRQVDVAKTIKAEQIALLKNFDQASLAQAWIFNLMVSNPDWNVLGIKNHNMSIKNVELFRDANNRIFTVPYDFSEASWVSQHKRNQVTSVEAYSELLESSINALDIKLDGFLIEAIKAQATILAEKLEKAAAGTEFDVNIKAQAKNFASALKTIK
ncbi:MAG: hypothetical protein EOP04_07810 [Proteobacteria bacterium]|nr:MAG: hypothetical protein EOP04_07810 [Pseudomonadota bacterium]